MFKSRIIKSTDELPLTKELIEGLEDLFPERCPKVTDSERDIWMYSGKRELVLILKYAYERQLKYNKLIK